MKAFPLALASKPLHFPDDYVLYFPSRRLLPLMFPAPYSLPKLPDFFQMESPY